MRPSAVLTALVGAAAVQACDRPATVPACDRPAAAPDCPGPAVNEPTLYLVTRFIPFSSGVRKSDDTGLYHIGYNHTCEAKGCPDIKLVKPLTRSTGRNLMATDLIPTQDCVKNAINNATLNENQYGALVAWTFSVGCESIGPSDLIKRLNTGEDVKTVLDFELLRWDKKDGLTGRTYPGYTRRRIGEINLSHMPTSEISIPTDC